MATSVLAKTTFNSGPDETLATIDAYSKKITSGSFNSYQDLNFDFGLDDLSALTGLNTKDLSTLIKTIKSKKLSLSLDEIMGRMFGDNPALMTLYRSLNAALQAKFKLNKLLSGRVRINLGGVPFYFNAKDLTNAKALSKMVDGFTNGNYKIEFRDQGALAGRLSSLINNSIDQGLPQVYSKTIVTTDDRKVQLQATSDIAKNVVKNKNISVLKEIADGPVASELKNVYPDIIKDFIADTDTPEIAKIQTTKEQKTVTINEKRKNNEVNTTYPDFTFDSNITQNTLNNQSNSEVTKDQKFEAIYEKLKDVKEKDFKKLYDDLKTSFVKIDPNWNKTLRDEEEILFLDLITPFSAGVFHKLVESKNFSETKPITVPAGPITDIDAIMPVYDSDECFYALVRFIGKQNAGSILKNSFRTVSFTTTPVQTNHTPSLLGAK